MDGGVEGSNKNLVFVCHPAEINQFWKYRDGRKIFWGSASTFILDMKWLVNFVPFFCACHAQTEFIPFAPYQDPISIDVFTRIQGVSQYVSVIGGDQGAVSFWNVQANPPVLIKTFTVSSNPVSITQYNTVNDYLAVVSPSTKLTIYSFSNVAGFVPGASLVLQNTYPIDAVSWNKAAAPSTPRIAIGSRSGLVDEYMVTMPTTMTAQALTTFSMNRRWFVGCPVNYLSYLTPSTIIVGCSTGKITWLLSPPDDNPSSVPISPIASVSLRTPPSDYVVAKYKKSGLYLVAVLELTVYIVEIASKSVVFTVDILPYVTPLSPNRAERVVRSISTYTDPVTHKPTSLVLRTTESIIQFDLTPVLSGTVNFWKSGISLADLITSESSVHHVNPVRIVTSDNFPYVDVSMDEEVIDFTPCYNVAAELAQVGDLSNIFCVPDGPLNISQSVSETPIVSLDFTVNVPFTKVRGSFKLRSTGTLPAQDCSLGKQPIPNWFSDQQSTWSLLRPQSTQTSQLSSVCRELAYWPTKPITSLTLCKELCTQISSCNLILFGGQNICNIRHCSSRPPISSIPSGAGVETWFLSSRPQLSTSFYGGYVAFGTESKVVYGGCQSPNGLIPTDNTITITIPETDLGSLQSVLRLQVSQYTAEARVRLSELNLDLYSPYLSPKMSLAEPANMPGEFIYPIRDPRPGTNDAPLIISPDGTMAITTNRRGYIGIFTLQ